MSNKRKSDTSTDVIRFDEYMEKGIPDSLLEGLGLVIDDEDGKPSEEEVDIKLDDNNIDKKVENSEVISENVSIKIENFEDIKFTLNSENNNSDLDNHSITKPSSSYTKTNNFSNMSNESLNLTNFLKRPNYRSEGNCIKPQNSIINDPVTMNLTSQVVSITGNVSELEDHKLLSKSFNYTNDKSVKLEPVCQSVEQTDTINIDNQIDTNEYDRIKENFNTNLTKLIENKCSNKGFITKEKYIQLTNDIIQLKLKTTGKSPADYQRLKRYDVIKIGDCNKLIYPIKDNKQTLKFYVYIDEIFNIIHNTHILIDHGGRNRMMYELQKMYKNITVESVMVYLSLCEPCKKKTMAQRLAHLSSKQNTNLNKKSGAHNQASYLGVINTASNFPPTFSKLEFNNSNDFPIDKTSINDAQEDSIKSTQNIGKPNYRSDVSGNNQQNLVIKDPVAEILASQIESIAGNVTDVEKQKLLRKCLNYANDKSVKLEPAMTQRSGQPSSKQNSNLIKKNGTHNQASNITASVIKTTSNFPHAFPIVQLNPNNDFPIDETNINEVLENSIKSTQNLRYLLSAFKEDLRRVGITSNSSNLILTKEQLKKKQDVAEKLKQAYELYKRSVRRNIEKSRNTLGENLAKKDVIIDEIIELSEDSD